MTHRKPVPIVLILMLLVSWGVMVINIDLPWWENGGDNGAWISSAVRNYDRLGASEIGFLPILNFEPTTPDTYEVYINHPPMIVWQTAITSKLFGFYEMSFRYLAMIMTLISTAGMYVLLRRLTHNPTQTLWGTALYAFTPMMLYYGRMPNHEAPALAFVLIVFCALVNLSHRVNRRDLLIMVIFTVLCAWTAWAVLIFIGIAGLWLLWLNPKRNWKIFLSLGLTAFLSVVALIAYYQSVYPDTIAELLDVFVYRTSNQQLSRGSAPFTLTEFVWQNFVHTVSLFTPSMLFLSAFGIWFSRKRANRRTIGMIVVLFASAFAYFLVFRNATYIHNYYKIYLAPAFALSASFAMVAYQPHRGRWRRGLMAGMQGFIVGGIATGGFFFVLLHQSADRPQLDQIRALFAEHTDAGDRVLTNLYYAISPLSFYASIDLRDDIPPESIPAQVEADSDLIYLYCDTGDVDPFTEPDSLSDYDSIETETCFLYLFDDEDVE